MGDASKGLFALLHVDMVLSMRSSYRNPFFFSEFIFPTTSSLGRNMSPCSQITLGQNWVSFSTKLPNRFKHRPFMQEILISAASHFSKRVDKAKIEYRSSPVLDIQYPNRHAKLKPKQNEV
jgi:hypothetical protein